MYRNVIFDIGGVMVNFKPRDFLMERFHNAKTEEKVYRITFGSEEWKQLDAGSITRYAASQAMLEAADKADLRFEVQEVIDEWTTILDTRQGIVEIAAQLKQRGFHLYYLSNIPADVLEMLEMRPFWSLFEGGVASCEVHLNKPDPAIYKALLERYALKASESIFIDDNQENISAAFQVGLTSILMKGSGKKLISNLAVCGIKL